MAFRTNPNEYTKKLANVTKNIIAIEKYVKSDQHIKHKCLVCKHIWSPTPTNILRGHGCPNCSHPAKKKTNKQFRKELATKHKGKIIALEKYKTAITPIKFKCDKGHVFLKTARMILRTLNNSNGCPKCKAFLTRNRCILGIKEYKKRIRKKFFKSIKVISKDYIANNKLLLHKCKKGHLFKSSPSTMFSKYGEGCPNCCIGKQSKIALIAIKQLSKKCKLDFQFEGNGGEHRVIGTEKKYRLDAYNEKYNIAVEFHGDYFHGGKKGCQNRQLYKATLRRDKDIKEAGYKLFTIWEWDFKGNPKKCIKRYASLISIAKHQFPQQPYQLDLPH